MGAEGRGLRADAVWRNAQGRGIRGCHGEHLGQVLRPALVAQKEEGAVLLDGTTGGQPVVVTLELGFRLAGGQEKGPRAEEPLAGEAEQRPPDGIAARSRERILQAAGDPAELGRKVRDGLKLLDRLLAHHQVACAALQVVRHPVDIHLPQTQAPIHRRRCARARTAGRQRTRIHTRLQHKEVEDAAADRRYRSDRALVVGVRLHRAARLDDRQGSGHLHRLGEAG